MSLNDATHLAKRLGFKPTKKDDYDSNEFWVYINKTKTEAVKEGIRKKNIKTNLMVYKELRGCLAKLFKMTYLLSEKQISK